MAVFFPEDTEEHGHDNGRCYGSGEHAVGGVDAVLSHKDEDEGQADEYGAGGRDTSDLQIVPVFGFGFNVGAVDVVEHDGADGSDERVGGGHQCGGEGCEYESEDAGLEQVGGGIDKGVFTVGFDFAVGHERGSDPAATGDGDGGDGVEDEDPEDGHFTSLFDAFQGQEAHDHALVHEDEGARIGESVLTPDANETKAVGAVEFGENEFVAAGEQFPKAVEAAEMDDADEEESEAGDEEDNALYEVGHDDGSLPAGKHVEHDDDGGACGADHNGESGEGLNELSEGEEVDADVADEIEEDEGCGGVARGLAEATFEIFRDGLNAAEVNDREPDEHENGHPEPIVQIGLSTAESETEPDVGIFYEAVAADGGGDSGKGDEPPGEALAAEEKVFGAGGVFSEPESEADDRHEIDDHDCDVDGIEDEAFVHWEAPGAACATSVGRLGSQKVKAILSTRRKTNPPTMMPRRRLSSAFLRSR